MSMPRYSETLAADLMHYLTSLDPDIALVKSTALIYLFSSHARVLTKQNLLEGVEF